MAPVRHHEFMKSNFLTVGAVKKPILHHRAKFRKDQSNRCEDIAILVIFKMAAAVILDFQKFEILTVGSCANVRKRAKFHQNRSSGCNNMAI